MNQKNSLIAYHLTLQNFWTTSNNSNMQWNNIVLHMHFILGKNSFLIPIRYTNKYNTNPGYHISYYASYYTSYLINFSLILILVYLIFSYSIFCVNFNIIMTSFISFCHLMDLGFINATV